MRIAVLPHGVRPKAGLARVALNQLRWPLGDPVSSGTIGDLGPDDHLLIYPRYKYLIDPRIGLRCRISLLIAEPYALHRNKYLGAVALQKRFYRIVTHRPAMARLAGNAIVMPFGGAWVDPVAVGNPEKSRSISLIASAKKKLEGHALRHRIAAWSQETDADVDLLGLAYKPFDRKEDGLAPYRYSVVIENSREDGYFTEKLIDCLLCGTLPIYWGAPDIERFFDPDGLIVCRTEEEIKEAIGNASEAQFAEKQAALNSNRERALAYVDYEKSAAIKLAKSNAQ